MDFTALSNKEIAEYLDSKLYWGTKNDIPNKDLSDNEVYSSFSLTWEQFESVQYACSGSDFCELFSDSVGFIVDREHFLHTEATEYQEQGDGYTLPIGYCSFGYWFEEETNDLILWYETTRGTIFATGYIDNKLAYEVYLPKVRALKGRVHYDAIQEALAGMTAQQRAVWHNDYLFPEEEFYQENYREHSEWHNTHMVELGYAPMLTFEQWQMKHRLDKVLNYIHGDWSQRYGIGQNIKHCIQNPQDCEMALSAIHAHLQKALDNWKAEFTVIADDEEYDYNLDE